MPRYERIDFEAVIGVADTFYCPGCNASADDYDLPSVGCPCDSHGGASGSLTVLQVKRYLDA